MLYGNNGTIHRTTNLNIEVDADGDVVSVWYRCLALPFDVTKVDDERATEMRRMYSENERLPILAIEVADREPPSSKDFEP